MAIAKSGGQKWSSKLAFLLATIGFSVGLGNIWRFPYVTGESGGGAFVLVYLLCVLLIGLPLVMAEMAIGRRGQGTPWESVARVAKESGRSGKWGFVGALTMFTAFLITSYYAVIGGWTLDYTFRGLGGEFLELDGPAATALFEGFLADSWRMLIGHSLFLILVGWVVSKGLTGGIEKAVNILMPLLFSLVLFLAIYSLWVGDASKGLGFLFNPDFSKISFATVLSAVGQAFFSVGVAMAAMMMYGAYLDKDEDITSSALVVCLVDTGVALVAGVAIFPLVFAFGLEPSGGAGLVFQTLPAIFAEMTGGWFFAPLFFLALVCAAFTSCIAITEPWVAWFEEHGYLRRKQAIWLIIGLLWLIGVIVVFSMSGSSMFIINGMTFFEFVDYISNSIFLPIGGLLIALFAGWCVKPAHIAEELGKHTDSMIFKSWIFLVKFIIPIILILLIIFGISE
ncbi:sodium-dependent transporter [Kordiimonas pumila]|uniref:Transporter n=1 Tax=Kordiimonas pumila TaxID=2161677 RepID=A0ABV7D7T5_9PROT|nr:sodium-dependent transporter [Kordiimonas pumila]